MASWADTPTERLADKQTHDDLYELLAEGFERIQLSAGRREAEAGFPMADFECKHGRLPVEGCAECEAERSAA